MQRRQQLAAAQSVGQAPMHPPIPAWDGKLVGATLVGARQMNRDGAELLLMVSLKQPNDEYDPAQLSLSCTVETARDAASLIGHRVQITLKDGAAQDVLPVA
jgi:hypothetical protein